MRKLVTGLIAALIGAGSAHAQIGGDSFQFIKAVKDRDVLKAREVIDHPGSTIVNSRDADTGLTGLHLVTRDRDLGWMQFLLQEGADPNARDKTGGTALLVAADQHFLEGAKLLLAERADIDASNRNGETALIKAVQGHDVQMVRLLVENGASAAKTDNVAGLSALDYAKQDRRSTMIARMLEEGRAAPSKAPQSAASFSIAPKRAPNAAPPPKP